MSAKKSYPLNNQEELLTINPEDQPLSPEQVEDLESPINEAEALKLPDIFKVKDVLAGQGLELLSDREICSGGVFGPIFKLKVKEIASGQEFYIIERSFTEIKDIERRFCLVEMDDMVSKNDSEPRYEIINNADHHKNKIVIDYLYNEERALKALQGIPGIPKFYGAAYDDLSGSLLQEFVDGPDLSMLLLENKESLRSWNIPEILEKLKNIYTQAAEAGFIHNNPAGATVMIGPDRQPYLADWYLYSQGLINQEGPIKEQYLEGLKGIEEVEKRLLDSLA
jgi:hypothetical protein